MIINTSIVGLPTVKASGNPAAPGGTFGEVLDSKLNPDYYTLVKNNKVFFLSASAQNPAAFAGGAAGTPLAGIYNPANSGVDLVFLLLKLNIRSTGTVAQTTQGFSFWGVNQGGTAPSGTQTVPRAMYSQAAAGSSAYCMVNVANTGALASNYLQSSVSVGNATVTAGVNVGVLYDELKGSIVVAPGNYVAYGAFLAMTAGAVDFSLIWAELPA